ncbi:MAG: CPBP family intramembrane metalloprotease [Planctomycetes bacterium]|nr:CPBP family intramembrane metalloprotease [Planctomycetota bacterium]
MSASPAKAHALLALLLLVPVASLGTSMGLWITPGLLGQGVYLASKIWILILPALWLIFIDRERPSLSPPRRGGFLFGIASGLAISAAIVVAYYLLAAGQLDPAALRALAVANGFDRFAVYVGFAAYLILVNSLLEEYVWRWFVYTRWEALLHKRVAAVAAALCFTLHHVLALRSFLPWGLTILGASGVFVGGVVWSWSYGRYRSIWPGYLSHALVDAAILAVGWRLLNSAS